MGIYYKSQPIVLDHFWGIHTETILSVVNGVGIFGVCCLALMVLFVPSCYADDEEWLHGWRTGRPYKMRIGRRIGIVLGWLGFSSVGVFILAIVLAGLTMAGIVGLAVFRG